MPRAVNVSVGMLLRKIGGGKLFDFLAPYYRQIFFSIEGFIEEVIVPEFRNASTNILDVGGGDGAVLKAIIERFNPEVCTFVDPTESAGRMLKGMNVELFKGTYLHEIQPKLQAKYQIILLVDVLHHVHSTARENLILECLKHLSKDGKLIIKEIGKRGIRSKLTLWADVYISRDPVVDFLSDDELRKIIGVLDPTLLISTFENYNNRDFPNYCLSVQKSM